MKHQTHAARVDADSLLSQIAPRSSGKSHEKTYDFGYAEEHPCSVCQKSTSFYFEVELKGKLERRFVCCSHGPVTWTPVFADIANSIHWRNIRINRRKLMFKIQIIRKLAGRTLIPDKTYSKGET